MFRACSIDVFCVLWQYILKSECMFSSLVCHYMFVDVCQNNCALNIPECKALFCIKQTDTYKCSLYSFVMQYETQF